VIRTGREDGLGVHLAVRDEGVGIDVQTVRRLFEPFFTTKSGGMGIGLSISRSIIENHHGRLWAAPNDGPGATFTFTVPLDADRASGRDASGESQASVVVDAAQLTRIP
jgi:signal transduction histidine kinase